MLMYNGYIEFTGIKEGKKKEEEKALERIFRDFFGVAMDRSLVTFLDGENLTKVRLNNFLAPLGDLESLLDCLVQHAYDMGLHISGRILEASVCGAYYLTDEGTIHLPLEKRWKMEATDEEILEVARKRELIC